MDVRRRIALNRRIEERILSGKGGLSLDGIIALLDAHHQRATYGAVAELVGVLPRGLMSGRPRSYRDSWIVAASNGWPTGYSQNQIHPECLRQASQGLGKIVETGQELRRWIDAVKRAGTQGSENLHSGQRGPAPNRLPYDMGNAGDLVKHGILAEFTQWWCEQHSGAIRYLDPFAGLPWDDAPNPEVIRRVEALRDCAMLGAQPSPRQRYYGSAMTVFNSARAVGGQAHISVSDSDERARAAFKACEVPFQSIALPGFSASDGFSILRCSVEADLLLLDPFADFLPQRASQVIPQIPEVSPRVACVLFVLNRDPSNHIGRDYRRLRATHLRRVWSIRCPTERHVGPRGSRLRRRGAPHLGSARRASQAGRTDRAHGGVCEPTVNNSPCACQIPGP